MSPLNDAPVGRPTGSRRRPRRRRGQQQLVDRDQLETVVMAYLAGPVAALPSSDHDCIRALGASIDGALSEGVRNLDLPWTIKVVHPSWELHPDRRSVSDRELWEHNRNVLLGQADALIITDVGLTAAGFGAACELDLHCLQDGPVLYLRDQACGTHSRYLEGRRREIDLTVRTYQDVREIPGLAERWIKERANAIETARLRRSDRRRQYEPLRKRLVASWGELDDHQRKFVAGTARLKPVLINDALGSTESLYTLPSHKLDSLCAALDVDRVHTRPREGEDQATMPPNYEALLAVALDEGWPSGELRMLFEQSQDEHSDLLRTGAALRQRRNTQADWKARRREL